MDPVLDRLDPGCLPGEVRSIRLGVLGRCSPGRDCAGHRLGATAHAAPSDISRPVLAWIGLALFLAGLAVAIWARVHLGRNWGMPMSEKADAELVTTGPYRWIRNPIYSGLILAMIGTALAVSAEWLLVVVVLGDTSSTARSWSSG